MTWVDAFIGWIFGWHLVAAGLGLAAWGVYRRSCRWVIAGVAFTLPFAWLFVFGYHLAVFLLLPALLLLACPMMRQTPRIRGFAPIFAAAGLLTALAYALYIPRTGRGQTLCAQYKPFPSPFEFLLMAFLAMAILMSPFIVVLAWRRNQAREQVFWQIAITGMLAAQLVSLSCDSQARPAAVVWEFVVGLALVCALGFVVWLGWQWRRDADAVRERKASWLLGALILFATGFSAVVSLSAAGSVY